MKTRQPGPVARMTRPGLPRPLALAVACLFAAQPGHGAGPTPALPSGLQVVQGRAALATAGNRLTVTNSANAVLNWQQFSIGAANAVHFAQPTAASKVLNRVVGSDPSAILGSLSSNGQVWLLNPNGILFGAGARVDVAGLVASTLQIGDADWAAGRLNLAGSADGAFGAAASIVNQGELRTVNGGRVLLIGSGSVRNEGLIEAPDGQVLLAAGRSVELVDSGLPNLAVKVTAPQGEAVNLGSLLAGGGRIDLQAALVNQQGIVRADSLTGGRGGELLLLGSNGVDLGAGSQTTANSAAGGQVSIDGGSGTTLVAGGVSALGDSGQGGGITLLGRQVGLLDGSTVDVSGAAGGGAVRVGGGLQGRDAAYRNAEAVYMAPGAMIAADATAHGDGGLVVLWSDNATRAYGTLSARGGPSGGNGGFIETSGGWLDARPASIRTDAPAGRAGDWLIDPYDITIADTGSEFIQGNPDFSGSGTGSAALLLTSTIVSALDSSNVTVTTAGLGTGSGDITMANATIDHGDLSAPGARTLTLTADRDIVISGSVLGGYTGQPLSLSLNAGRAVSLASSTISNAGGAVAIQALSTSITGTTIDTSAVLNSATPATPTGGIVISTDSLTLGAGSTLRSAATGTVIVLQGRSANTAMSSFVNQGGATALAAPNGAWRVHVADSDGASVFTPGGLAADFWQYNAFPDSTAAQSGNGFLFVAAPVLAMGSGGFQREYDGSTAIDLASFESALTGWRSNLTLVAAPVFTGSNAANGVGINLVGNGLGQFVQTTDAKPVYGYQVNTASLVGDIAQRLILVDAVTVADKVYDGNNSATATGWTLSNIVLADQLQVQVADSSVLFLDSAGVGNNKVVEATAISLTGAAAGNYFLDADFQTVTGAASITPRPLTMSNVVVANKVYDGNTTASVTSWTLSGLVGADEVDLGTASGIFGSASAGVGKTVQTTLGALTGPDAANYMPAAPSNSAAASITPRPLTLTSVAVADKVYDGNTSAAVTSWTLANLVGTDQVQVATGTGQFSSAGVGVGKPVLAIASSLTGADAGNYSLVAASQLGSAAITPRPLTLASVSVADKVYDGNTLATVTGWSLSNVVAGEQVQVAGSTGEFLNAGAGVAVPVLASASGLAGADAANYSLAPATLAGSAAITPRPLSVSSVTVADKVYDGNTLATVTGWSLSNVIASDQVQVTAGTGQFSAAGVGANKPVLAIASGLGGADAANYRLGTAASASGSAAISPAPLLYLADPASGFTGLPLPPLTGTVTGFVNGETLAGTTTGRLVFSTPATEVSPPGRYAIDGGGLAAANYSFSQAPGNATALALALPSPVPETAPPNVYVTKTAVEVVLLDSPATSPAVGRTLDAVRTVLPAGGDRTNFAALDLANLSPSAVAGVLAARDEYKKSIFQPALDQLEQDPTRADAPGCANVQQAATGQCLITAPLAGGQALSDARVVDRSAVAVPPAAGAAAPTAVGAPGPAPVPTPVPAAAARAAAAAALPPRPPQPVVDLPARRGVKLATLPQIQRKIALVIGIDQYSDARIPRLANAAKDARAVAASLEANLGYETVVLENANRSGIFRALNQLVGQVGPADSVVIYYAGHGERAEKSGLGYWQPADADAARPETWISNADIDRVLRQLPASQVAMISDSCYSGSLVSGDRIRGATGPQDPTALLGRRAAVVMTSGGNEPVFDSGKNGHSPFAWSLMQSLQQVSTWKAGSSVFEQVRFAVARQLPQRPQYAAAPNAGHQPGADFLFEQRQLEGVVK